MLAWAKIRLFVILSGLFFSSCNAEIGLVLSPDATEKNASVYVTDSLSLVSSRTNTEAKDDVLNGDSNDQDGKHGYYHMKNPIYGPSYEAENYGQNAGSAEYGSSIYSLQEFDVINYWNNVSLDAIRVMLLGPPLASRTLAIVHIAMYDAVNSITRKHKKYAIQVTAKGDESKVVAGGKAAFVVLSHLFPSLCFRVNLEKTVASVAAGVSSSGGMRIGLEVANAILALRANDGASMADDPNYNSDSTVPGRWRRAPDTNRMTRRELPGLPALNPRYGDVMPFGIPDPSSFVPVPPPGGAPAIDNGYVTEVKALGSVNSKIRTREQSVIAVFWAAGPGTATPPGHLNIAAQVVTLGAKLNIEEKARLFALLNIALADAGIVAWKTKYLYNAWRPISAIRDAPDPRIRDPLWVPLLLTPNFPSYISGHSTFAGAYEEVMKGFFGTDDITFTLPSEDPECPRTYRSFSQAAEEDAASRVYGGAHFKSDDDDGIATGRRIGQYIFDHYL